MKPVVKSPTKSLTKSATKSATRSLTCRALGLSLGVALVASLTAGLSPQASAASISFGNKIDMDKLKKIIEEASVKAYAPAKVGKVTCPKSIKPKTGGVFNCTVPVADGILNITVTQKDNKGNVVYAAKEAVIDMGKIVKFVQDEVLSDLKVAAKADCGKGIVRILPPGGIIKCKAVAKDGDSLDLIVTVNDVDGNVTLAAA
jgi:Domain of unknown function (DUF4333)